MSADCPRHGPRRMEQDGPLRYCGECAWEDPNNPEVPPPPSKEKEIAMEPSPSVAVLGTKELGEMCRARIAQLEREVGLAEKRHKERIAAARDEIGKLKKIAAFCGASLTEATKRGGGGGAWECPNCGEKRHGRSIPIHKAECSGAAA